MPASAVPTVNDLLNILRNEEPDLFRSVGNCQLVVWKLNKPQESSFLHGTTTRSMANAPKQDDDEYIQVFIRNLNFNTELVKLSRDAYLKDHFENVGKACLHIIVEYPSEDACAVGAVDALTFACMQKADCLSVQFGKGPEMKLRTWLMNPLPDLVWPVHSPHAIPLTCLTYYQDVFITSIPSCPCRIHRHLSTRQKCSTLFFSVADPLIILASHRDVPQGACPSPRPIGDVG
jgi:hypothetical protein